jgi:hypothetical protein
MKRVALYLRVSPPRPLTALGRLGEVVVGQ